MDRIEERNLFYVAPLALIALLGLAADGVVPRAGGRVAIAAVVAGVLPVVIPFAPLHQDERRLRHASRCCRGGGCRTTGSTSTSCAGRRSRVAARRGRAVRLRCRAGTRSCCRRSSAPTSSLTRVRGRERPPRDPPGLGRHALGRASASPHPDWIDRAVGRDAYVASSGTTARRRRGPLWDNEFFNRSVGAGLHDRRHAARRPAARDAGRRARRRHARRRRRHASCAREYALVDGSTDLAGRVVARDPGSGSTLYRVDGPLVMLDARDAASTRRHLVGPQSSPTGALDCAGGTPRGAASAATRTLFTRDQIVTARAGGRGRRPRAHRAGRAADADACRSRPAPTARCTVRSPSRRTRRPGRAATTRRLGAHFLSFDYRR